MRRREFIALISGAAGATWPLVAHAQQPVLPVVGFMHVLSPENVPRYVPAFRQGLKEQGFVEGQNLTVEYRWAYGQYERLPELAADLVRRQVSVLAATGGQPSPQVAEAATQTIPIVFTTNGDPVREGLVASLSQPGRNATGVTIFGPASVTKRLQLIHQLLPQAAGVAYLMNPDNPDADLEMNMVQDAAHSLGMNLRVFSASNEREIEGAFATMSQQKVDALSAPPMSFCLVAANRLFHWQRMIGYQRSTTCRRLLTRAVSWLRQRSDRYLSLGGDIRWTFSQRRKTSRLAGIASN